MSIRYQLYQGRRPLLQDYLASLLAQRPLRRDVWALHDVTLSVQRGEVFGLVDSNGSGKSTLLKVVARILRPAAGRVVVYVAPAAALELYGRLCDEAIALDGAALVNAAPELAAETDDARPARLAERLAGATALFRAEADLAALRPALATSQTELTILQLVLEAREAEVAFLQPALAAREIEIAGFTRELGSCASYSGLMWM